MSSDRHHDQIRDQYTSSRGRHFYQTVMGDGGFDIHYGIYHCPDTSMQQATLASTQRLLALANESIALPSVDAVLDLGSGRGGTAHFLARDLGATITCVDLCESHHDENLRRARQIGIDDKIKTWTGSFESLPSSWDGVFDLAWAQETLCHSQNLAVAIENAYRATRSGGAFVVSDIMLSDDASQSDADSFSSVNAVSRLNSPSDMMHVLSNSGYENVQFENWTEYLAENFRRMRHQIECNREKLISQGVSDDFLAKFSESLRNRLLHSGTTLQWGAFTGRKIRA